HIIFFTGFDSGGCEDCHRIRRCLREQTTVRQDHPSPVTPQSGSELSPHDDIVHKVLISLHPKMTSLTIQVRGISPCCTLKEVLKFLEVYFDDSPEEDEGIFNDDQAS